MQKATIIIAVLLVVASLSIGINIGLTWNNPSSTPTIPETTIQTTPNTNTPIPYGTPNPKVMVAYDELSRTAIGNNTRLTLSVNAYLSVTYGNSVTLTIHILP
jgi:hypothetical protein